MVYLHEHHVAADVRLVWKNKRFPVRLFAFRSSSARTAVSLVALLHLLLHVRHRNTLLTPKSNDTFRFRRRTVAARDNRGLQIESAML